MLEVAMYHFKMGANIVRTLYFQGNESGGLVTGHHACVQSCCRKRRMRIIDSLKPDEKKI
jgi:hypothetical protein